MTEPAPPTSADVQETVPVGASSHAADPGPATRWHVLATVCAWLLPGLGHVVIGQRRRGAILGITILTLWTSGWLIGGISCIEVRSPEGQFRPWFLGQMLLAPSLAVAWYHQSLRDGVVPEAESGRADYPGDFAGWPIPMPDDLAPAYEPGFGRVAEQGVLYTALAGMLNLLAIIDVLYRDPKTVARQEAASSRVQPARLGLNTQSLRDDAGMEAPSQ